jgi:hypothetical protein
MTDSLNGTSINPLVMDALREEFADAPHHAHRALYALNAAGFVVVRDSSGLLNHGDTIELVGYQHPDGPWIWLTPYHHGDAPVWRRAEVDPT